MTCERMSRFRNPIADLLDSPTAGEEAGACDGHARAPETPRRSFVTPPYRGWGTRTSISFEPDQDILFPDIAVDEPPVTHDRTKLRCPASPRAQSCASWRRNAPRVSTITPRPKAGPGKRVVDTMAPSRPCPVSIPQGAPCREHPPDYGRLSRCSAAPMERMPTCAGCSRCRSVGPSATRLTSRRAAPARSPRRSRRRTGRSGRARRDAPSARSDTRRTRARP